MDFEAGEDENQEEKEEGEEEDEEEEEEQGDEKDEQEEEHERDEHVANRCRVFHTCAGYCSHVCVRSRPG